ncbi:MAG TPA: hypothetical protein VGN39_18455, partial [Terriglobales bacterium]|nr:hypothetical protein [Terriglobales bacterium]
VAVIDAAKVSPPISKYMYGMFLEHLGSLTYRSLWSEVLDDRKFYFPVTSAKPEETPRPAFRRPLRNGTPLVGMRSSPWTQNMLTSASIRRESGLTA